MAAIQSSFPEPIQQQGPVHNNNSNNSSSSDRLATTTRMTSMVDSAAAAPTSPSRLSPSLMSRGSSTAGGSGRNIGRRTLSSRGSRLHRSPEGRQGRQAASRSDEVSCISITHSDGWPSQGRVRKNLSRPVYFLTTQSCFRSASCRLEDDCQSAGAERATFSRESELFEGWTFVF